MASPGLGGRPIEIQKSHRCIRDFLWTFSLSQLTMIIIKLYGQLFNIEKFDLTGILWYRVSVLFYWIILGWYYDQYIVITFYILIIIELSHLFYITIILLESSKLYILQLCEWGLSTLVIVHELVLLSEIGALFRLMRAGRGREIRS